MLRDMFKKTYTLIDTKYKNHSKNEPNIPEGLWRKCKKCRTAGVRRGREK